MPVHTVAPRTRTRTLRLGGRFIRNLRCWIIIILLISVGDVGGVGGGGGDDDDDDDEHNAHDDTSPSFLIKHSCFSPSAPLSSLCHLSVSINLHSLSIYIHRYTP